MEHKLCEYINGFRKFSRTKHSLLTTLDERRKNALGIGEKIYVLSIDLSKTFHTINHNLPMTNLKVTH